MRSATLNCSCNYCSKSFFLNLSPTAIHKQRCKSDILKPKATVKDQKFRQHLQHLWQKPPRFISLLLPLLQGHFYFKFLSNTHFTSLNFLIWVSFIFLLICYQIDYLIRIEGGLSKFFFECNFLPLPESSFENGLMTPDSILEPVGPTRTSSGSDGYGGALASCDTIKIVKKKRSSITACRSVCSPVPEMSVGLMNRRKKTPQRAPLYWICVGGAMIHLLIVNRKEGLRTVRHWGNYEVVLLLLFWKGQLGDKIYISKFCEWQNSLWVATIRGPLIYDLLLPYSDVFVWTVKY